MEFKCFVVPLLTVFIAQSACAEGFRLGAEYDSTLDHKTNKASQAFTLLPGWDFPHGHAIDRMELLLEESRDSPDKHGLIPKGHKVFVRLRHDGEFSERLHYYLRGGMGRSTSRSSAFNYAYVEPGLSYKAGNDWGVSLGYRDSIAIDGTRGQHVRDVLAGLNFALDRNDHLELIYIRGRRDKDLTTWAIQYVHSF